MFRSSMKIASWVLTSALMLTGILGCHPATIILPPHIHTIGLSVIENHTSQYGLESVCTQQILQELQADGRLLVVSDKSADLVLKMSIRQYQRDIILTNTTNNRPEQYRLSVVYNLTAIDQIDQKPLFEDNGRVRSVLFCTADYPGAIVETEDQALLRMAQDLAHSLVRRVIQGN
jgi:hypothetical protein